MKHYFTSLFGLMLFSFYSLSVFAQAEVEWDKTFGGGDYDQSAAIAAVPGDGFLIGGFSLSGATGDKTDPSFGGTGFYHSRDYWVVRADENGNKLWDKSYGGSTDDVLTAILRVSDGGFLLGGYSNSATTGNKTAPMRGSYDFWVIRIDDAGNILWQQTYGGAGVDELGDMAETQDGGFLLGGRSASAPSGNKTAGLMGASDMWVLRIDASGAILWDKTYGDEATNYLSDITVVPNGDFLLTGHTWVKTGEIEVDGEVYEQTTATIRAVRVDTNGNLLWDQLYEDENNQFVYEALVTDDEGFLLVGQGREGFSHQDGVVLKLSGAGTVQWRKLYGGNAIDYFVDAVPTPNGYLIGGSSYSDVSRDKSEPAVGESDFWLIEIDHAGNLLWDKTIGGKMFDAMAALAAVQDGEYLLAGFSSSDAYWHKTEDSRDEGTNRSDYWVVNVQLETDEPEPEPEPLPTNGFVRGGGWFHSPMQAITDDALHQGRALFSFVARKKPKDQQPKGHFFLLIPDADFRFTSSTLEWIHVDGDRALLKGSGMFDRQPGYTFLVSVLDEGRSMRGPKDKLRIIIWDEAQNIVYDNQRGAEIYAVAASPIAKGTIMVQDDEAGQNQARLAGQESSMELSSAGIKAYPVPLVKEGLWVELPAREQAGAWKLRIFDVQGRKVAETSIEGNPYGTKKHWLLVHHTWKEGVYLLEIKHGDEEYQLRILK